MKEDVHIYMYTSMCIIYMNLCACISASSKPVWVVWDSWKRDVVDLEPYIYMHVA